jgi:hypothetical protein
MFEKFRLKRKMLRLAKEIAPTGTAYWQAKGMDFRFTNCSVHASVELKNGVSVHVWSTPEGFDPLCQENTFLVKWFNDAVKVVEEQLIVKKQQDKRWQDDMAIALMERFEVAYNIIEEEEHGSMM